MIAKLILLYGLLFTSPLLAALGEGASPGNHLVNDDFDFRLKKPESWIPEISQSLRSGPSTTWFIHNRHDVQNEKDLSWVRVEFFSNIDISGTKTKPVDALCSYLDTHEPEWAPWVRFDIDNIAGCYAKDHQDPNVGDVTLGRQYYFITDKMFVALSSRKSPMAHGRDGVRSILNSVDRRSAGPIVKKISYVPADKVRVGEKVCAQVFVDNEHSSFTRRDLRAFRIQGFPMHWLPYEVQWNETLGVFNVCFDVTPSMRSADDLKVSSMSLFNEREIETNCGIYPPSVVLTCRYEGGQTVVIEQHLPEIINPQPLNENPIIKEVAIQRDNGRWLLVGKISSNIKSHSGAASLRFMPSQDEANFFITPWDIDGDQFRVLLRGLPRDGTVILDSVSITNIQGGATTLTRGVDNNHTPHLDLKYSQCDVSGKCAPSDVPVVEIFIKQH